MLRSCQIDDHAQEARALVRKVHDRAGRKQESTTALGGRNAKLESVFTLPIVQQAPDLPLDAVAILGIQQRTPVLRLSGCALESEKRSQIF